MRSGPKPESFQRYKGILGALLLITFLSGCKAKEAAPEPEPPEVDPINFAPRVTIPVLMVNGRYDFDTPLNTSQRPLFRWLGTLPKDKRNALFDTGHVPPRNETIKETLDWLDRYLGPAK